MNETTPAERAAVDPPPKPILKTFSNVWAPPLVVGLLACSSNFLLTIRNEETTRSRTYLELKVRHADATAQAFSDYVSVWRRVTIRCQIYVDSVAKSARLDDPEQRSALELRNAKRQEEIATLTRGQRAERHDSLFAKLDVVQLYFSDELINRVVAFRNWDELQQVKTCAQMPDIKDYQTRQTEILNGLKQEVKP